MTTIASLGDRLKYARERAGFTQTLVCERSGIGESSLSDFERGKREPALAQLATLADIYRRPAAFFLSTDPLPVEVVRWREKPEQAEEIEVRFLRLCEQYQNLESWCGASAATALPTAERPKSPFGRRDAESLAIQVRRELGLGDFPGPALLHVLEEQCRLKVFHLSFAPTGTAASTKSAGFGGAVLLNEKNPKWRRNFDLAHELFHLLTWDFAPGHTDAEAQWSESDEKLADAFAASLLMPTDAVRQAVDCRIRAGKVPVDALFEIARQFDVSVEALIWRIHALYGGNVNNRSRTDAMIQRAREASGMFEQRTPEVPPERPARFVALALTALREGNISAGRFAEYVGTSRQRAMEVVTEQSGDDDAIELPPP